PSSSTRGSPAYRHRSPRRPRPRRSSKHWRPSRRGSPRPSLLLAAGAPGGHPTTTTGCVEVSYHSCPTVGRTRPAPQEITHVEESSQEARPQEEGREPRQAPELLPVSPRVPPGARPVRGERWLPRPPRRLPRSARR